MKTQIIPLLRDGKAVMWSDGDWLASVFTLSRHILLDGQNFTHGNTRMFNQNRGSTASAIIYRIVP